MFVNYAHRGASSYRPENTLISFRYGLELGANGIELDLQITKDGKVVIFHDDVIDYKSNGVGRIIDYTYQELYDMDFGGWKGEEFKGTKICLFEEFAKEFLSKDLTFAIEIKAENLEREALEIIRKYKKHDNLYITSFKFDILKKVRELDKDIKISWLIQEPISEANVKQLLSIQGNQIAPEAKDVTKEGIALAEKNGLGVRLWGITDEEVMKKVYPLAPEGMTVNFPDKLKKLLDEKGL
jgi:glycerophosphoryl diester phosphodiesterase